MLKNYLGLLFLAILTMATDCGKEKYEAKRTAIYVKGQFSNTSDTMYVGDTLTLTIRIPDSSYRVSEYPPYDTTWQRIESFESKAFGYAMIRIDTVQEGNIDRINPYAQTIFIQGNLDNAFSIRYPYVSQIKKIFKMKGTYFFQSSYDLIPRINGIYGSMVIEWDVPYKNFELLRAWGEERYRAAIGSDAVDANNYFPFVVLER